MARAIVIEFLGDAKSFNRTADSVSGKSSSLGSKMKSAGKMAALGFAAAAGAAVVVGKKLVEAGERASTSNARIEQIAESMGLFGDQADEVSARLVKLAEKTALQTGMDQNAIKETQAKLLTFKELAATADEVGGAFDRATAAAVDMEAAGFGSASTNAVQLGKALNDPIKGITALGRAGITFSEAEQKRIAAMVEGGKVGQAQAKILGAIEKQVGGTAEATANASDQMSVAWSQVQERLGQKLLPVFNKVSAWVISTGLPAFERFGAFLREKVGPIIARVSDIVRETFGGLKGDVDGPLNDVKGIIRDAISIVTSLWRRFGGFITKYLSSTFKNVKTILGGALKVISGVFQVFSSLLKGDWRGVWDGIKKILSGALGIIKGTVKQALNTIRTVWRVAWSSIKGILGSVWDGIRTIARNGFDWLVGAIRSIPGKLRNLGSSFLGAGRALIGAFVQGMKNAAGIVSGIAGNVWDTVKRLLNGAIDKINAALEFTIKIPGPDIHINPPNIPRMYARGTGYHPGGLAIVGEEGPELVNLPRGSRVHTAAQTRAMAGSVGGDASSTIVVPLVVEGIVLERVLIKLSRRTGRPLQVRTLGPA